jgi:hypothetical protein
VHKLQIHEQGSKIQEHPSSVRMLQPHVNSSEGIIQTSLRCGVLTRFAIEIFSHELLNARKQKKYYHQATYKDKVLTFSQPSATLVFQEINHLKAIVTTRSTYDEHLEVFEVCLRGT